MRPNIEEVAESIREIIKKVEEQRLPAHEALEDIETILMMALSRG